MIPNAADASRTRLFGASIACAVGAWRCYIKGGTTYVPEYGQLNPGNPRFEMGNFDGLSPTYRCVLHPNQVRAIANGQACLASLYDTHIKATLEAVRARQVQVLRTTLLWSAVVTAGLCSGPVTPTGTG